MQIPNSERLFILGLLHNLGELIVQQFMPAKVEACYHVSTLELPWHKQKEILNFSYGECSGDLLKLWQLPYSLIEPIRNQDEDNFEYLTIETQLLYVAKRIMLLSHQCKQHAQSALLTDEKIANLNIDQQLISAARNFCDMERLAILAVLNPSAAMIY